MNSKDILNFKVNSLLYIRIEDSIDLYLELFNDISEVLDDGSISIERRLCSKHLKTLINSNKFYYIDPNGPEFPLKNLKKELGFVNLIGDRFWFEDGISWCSPKSTGSKCQCAQLTPDYINLLGPIDLYSLFSFGYLDDGNKLFYSFYDKIEETLAVFRCYYI